MVTATGPARRGLPTTFYFRENSGKSPRRDRAIAATSSAHEPERMPSLPPDDRHPHGFERDSTQGLDDQLENLLHELGGHDGAESDGPEQAAAEGERASADDYWSLSRTPLTSLVFTLPLVLAYEGGVLWLGRGSPRNGADVWLRQFLDLIGFGSYFLLPVLTLLGLLAWHHIEHDRWRFSPAVLAGMAFESLVWAGMLVGLARLQHRLWPLGIVDGLSGIFARFVGYCGAGLYEEVLFRLILLPVVVWVLERVGLSTAAAAFWSVILTSLLFSTAHYVGPLGDTFELYSFTFRTLAGIFFATLFVLRGFGIAAGAHAAYDMLVGLL